MTMGEARSGKTARDVAIRRAERRRRAGDRRAGKATTGQWAGLLARHAGGILRPQGAKTRLPCGGTRRARRRLHNGRFRIWSGAARLVFAVAVDPEIRVNNVGTRLFDEICGIFQSEGVERSRRIERATSCSPSSVARA